MSVEERSNRKMSAKSEKVQRSAEGRLVMMKRLWCQKLATVITCLVLYSSIFGLAGAVSRSGLQSEDSAPPKKVQKCREGCLDKVCVKFLLSKRLYQKECTSNNGWKVRVNSVSEF